MKYTIGVVGKECYDIFKRKLKDRKEESVATLKLVELDGQKLFYHNIRNNSDLISKEKLNILVGETSLSMAQAAAHQNIPYFATDTNVHPSNLFEYSNMPNFYSLLITDEVYSKAIIDLILRFEVSKVAVIVDSTVNYHLFARPFFAQKNISILIWTLTMEDSEDLKKLDEKIDKILRDSREAGCWDFVVKGNLSVVKQIITKARYYGMLVRPNKWYLPSFVCRDITIASIRQIHSNITMINEQCLDSYLSQGSNFTTVAVINKVIQLFRRIKWKLTANVIRQELKNGDPKQYDEMGMQTRVQLTLHTLSVEEEPGDLRLVGTWLYSRERSQLSYIYSKIVPTKEVPRVHLRVAAVEEHPHVIRQPNGSLVGFGIDLVSELSALMNATFTITLSPNMGIKEGKNWTGVIGELMASRADITLGPLVQSIEMEQVIDFSTSFKQREISLVMTAPSPSMSFFQFVQPFSWDVWLLCLVSTVFVTVLSWGIERIHDKYFDNKLPVKVNFKESSWFGIGNVLKKQLDVFPNSAPALINNASIFFFSLIIVTMYTANLAAFLTLQAYTNPIKEVEDLLKLPPNSPIIFGTVKDSAILEFFRESDLNIFKNMYQRMAVDNPHWLVNSTAEGYRRALKEQYVFIWDDSVNQFELFIEPEYDCKLIVVGRPFGKRSFAIGMQHKSEFKEKINTYLLDLLETGKVDSLLEKWWKGSSICTSNEAPNVDISPLSLSNVAGVFLIVVVGIIVAIVWFLVQVVIASVKKRKSSPNRQDTDGLERDCRENIPLSNNVNGMKGRDQ